MKEDEMNEKEKKIATDTVSTLFESNLQSQKVQEKIAVLERQITVLKNRIGECFDPDRCKTLE